MCVPHPPVGVLAALARALDYGDLDEPDETDLTEEEMASMWDQAEPVRLVRSKRRGNRDR